MDWTDHMQDALAEAMFSPDPSTQNGAVIIDRHGEVIARDHNRFPLGVEYLPGRWERPPGPKYAFIEHAERNAIYRCALLHGVGTMNATMVCPWASCADCARAIVQSGISRLVRLSSSDNTNARWDDSIVLGDTIMREGGVEIIDFVPVGSFGITLWRNGERVTF